METPLSMSYMRVERAWRCPTCRADARTAPCVHYRGRGESLWTAPQPTDRADGVAQAGCVSPERTDARGRLLPAPAGWYSFVLPRPATP